MNDLETLWLVVKHLWWPVLLVGWLLRVITKPRGFGWMQRYK